jgi:non-ribosomal peptide synthetase component F
LRLLVKHLKSGVSVFLEYRTSFIPTEHAKNVASTFDRIMSSLLTCPDMAVQSMNVLSERSWLQIEKWNSGPLENAQTTIHEEIYNTAMKVPNEEAVCAWDGSLTYHAITAMADRLGSYLSDLGVGPETIVPLCFDKSKWNVVSILGVLVAGGACKFCHGFLWMRNSLRSAVVSHQILMFDSLASGPCLSR